MESNDRKSNSSLFKLFDQLNRPTPTEIDPEDCYHSIERSKTKAISDDRKHEDEKNDRDESFVEVGPSEMRRGLGIDIDHSELDQKYPTKPISLKKLMKNVNGEEEGDEEEEEEEDDDDDDERNDKSGIEEDESGSSSSAIEEEDETGSSDSGSEEEEDDDGSERDEKDGTEERPTGSRQNSRKDNSSNERREEPQKNGSDLINQLRSSVKSDLLKAQAVKNQLSVYDRLISLRIGLQKTLVTTNQLILQNESGEKSSREEDEDRRFIGNELLRLSSRIGEWRTKFMGPINVQEDGKEEDENEEGLIRKRKIEEVEDDRESFGLESCLKSTASLDQRLELYMRKTIQKWFNKINSSSLLQQQRSIKSNKLERMDPIKHLELIWSDEEQRRKLIQRSQNFQDPQSSNSSSSKRQRRGSFDLNEDVNDDDDGEGDGRGRLLRVLNKNLFDDQEFYKSILKQVIESNQDQSGMIGLMNDYRSRRIKDKKFNERRSTKERRLNFKVHQKLVSFMVPIKSYEGENGWNDEQKDELFGSLFGIGFDEEDQKLDDDGERINKGLFKLI